MKVLHFLFASFMLFTLAGCSESVSSVSGKVTYEGEAIAEGNISFVPLAGEKNVKGASATIQNGSYTVNVPSGKYRVEITASKKIKLPPGEVGMNGEKEEVRQFLPAKYNAQSELKADVPASAPVDFKLTK